MAKVSYVSIVKEGLEANKNHDEILSDIKAAFPDMDEKKIKAKLGPTIKYIQK